MRNCTLLFCNSEHLNMCCLILLLYFISSLSSSTISFKIIITTNIVILNAPNIVTQPLYSTFNSLPCNILWFFPLDFKFTILVTYKCLLLNFVSWISQQRGTISRCHHHQKVAKRMLQLSYSHCEQRFPTWKELRSCQDFQFSIFSNVWNLTLLRFLEWIYYYINTSLRIIINSAQI